MAREKRNLAGINKNRKKQPSTVLLKQEEVMEEDKEEVVQEEVKEEDKEKVVQEEVKEEDKEKVVQEEVKEEVKEKALEVTAALKEKTGNDIIPSEMIRQSVSVSQKNVIFLNKEVLKLKMNPDKSVKANYSTVLQNIILQEKKLFEEGKRIDEDEIFKTINLSLDTATSKRLTFHLPKDLLDFMNEFSLETGIIKKTSLLNLFIERAKKH